MEVTTFDFEFLFKERKFDATCQKFQVHNCPQLRVAVSRGKIKTDFYILYEVNDKNHKYFWFRLPDMRQEIAKAIAKTLEKRK